VAGSLRETCDRPAAGYRGLLGDAPEVPVPDPGVALDVPGVAGVVPVADPGCDGVVPDTPVVGGVVRAPGPVPGAHGTAVPLVPVGAGAFAVEPVLRAVVLTASVGLALALAVLVDPDEALPGAPDGAAAVADVAVSPLLDADAGGAPDCARGPASAAVFTLPFDDVVVPVELFAWLVGDVALALALAEDGADCRPAEPDEPRPVTGTHGVVVGVVAGVVALG